MMKNTILLVLVLAFGLAMEIASAEYNFGTPDEIGTQAYGALIAWGLNSDGQCNVPRGNDFVAVSGGHWHSLALRIDGSLVSWGSISEAPSGNDFVAIASGSGHNLALKADGSLMAWGGTAYGKTEVPEGNDFLAIAARAEQNLALKADGSIVAWGLNNWGQCDVPEGNDFVAISAGHSHSVALKADGSLVSWGQLTEVPPGNDFVAISAGPMHNLALRADGSLASAGGNSEWHEGNVPAGNDFVEVATGSWHCLAIKADGSVVAWGRNLHGECNVPRIISSRKKSDVVAIAGAEGFHSLAIIAAQPAWQGLYFNDFEDIVGAEWSSGKTDVTPSARARGFLGQFGDETVTLTLGNLPAHTQATVSFDLFVLRSWDGNNQIHGPDVWQLKVAEGPMLLHTTFANAPVDLEDFRQAYPDDYPGSDYPPYTGAAEIKTLGYTDAPDSVYHLSFTFAHSENILRLDFSGQGLQGIQDESWGLDNVNVMISPADDFDGTVNPTDFHLIAHWKLDEDSGTTAYDSAGDNHGNVYEAQWTTGQIGGALSFDGEDDYVTMPSFNLTTNTVTFVAWINGWKAVSWAGIMYSRGPRGSRNATGMEFGSNNTLHYTWNDNSEETWGWEGGPEIPQNQWAMVALVIEPDKAGAYVYTDTGGLQVGVNNIPHMPQTVGDLKLGWDEHRDSRRFSGKIDDVRIYDRALSAAEVAELTRQGLYFNDFEDIVGSEWSNGKTDVTPSARARDFLGQFGNETVILTLGNLPAHTQATVSFDLFVLRSWDGNNQIHGPDIWQFKVDEGPTLLHTTFANAPLDLEDFRQAYPDDYPGSDYPPYTGAAEIKTLGYTDAPDSVYHLSFTFAHTQSTLRLDFSGQGLQEIQDESWGLDNVNVTISLAADFTGDGKVDINDWIILIEHWGQDEPSVDIAPPPFGDGIVDEQDLELLMRYWETEIP